MKATYLRKLNTIIQLIILIMIKTDFAGTNISEKPCTHRFSERY